MRGAGIRREGGGVDRSGRLAGDAGIALVSALIALALFSLIGLYFSLGAVTEVRIGDNYEALIQARYAALSGAGHARALLRGVDFDDLLRGPDGTYATTPEYAASARTFEFRNPFEWGLARFVDCVDPSADASGRPDDGLINTGAYGGAGGTVLIPQTGVPRTCPDDRGREVVCARYFVKVADNNGESTEMEEDASDSPFHDGDGVVVVRSMGLATTVHEMTGAVLRRNAVAVFESRFKRRSTFEPDAPLVVVGDAVLPADGAVFEGEGFFIQGDPAGFGIAVIDTDAGNGTSPALQIAAQLPADRAGNVAGAGSPPSIGDITARAAVVGSDKALLLDRDYLRKFVDRIAPQFADNVFPESQTWDGPVSPELGAYDPALPFNAPGQRPMATLVEGDLAVGGSVSGGGLLIVTGRLRVTGRFSFSGVILVVGNGEIELAAADLSISGAVLLASVSGGAGPLSWGVPKLTIGGNSRLTWNLEAVRTASRLIPPAQLGFREVTSGLDPKP